MYLSVSRITQNAMVYECLCVNIGPLALGDLGPDADPGIFRKITEGLLGLAEVYPL